MYQKVSRKIILSTLIMTSMLMIKNPIALAQGPQAPNKTSTQPPEKISTENTYQKEKGYEQTSFTHKKHAEEYKNAQGQNIACNDCHHVYKDGKNIWKKEDAIEKCSSCHKGNQNLSLKNAEKLPRDKMVQEISWAYHQNCYTCHKAYKESNKKSTAPLACAKCHPKKEKKN